MTIISIKTVRMRTLNHCFCPPAILGSEYCSGYIDNTGDWHTGFYCPVSDDNINIFCCGGLDNKYCCTKKDQVVQEEVEGLTLLLGCMLGVLTACLMVTLAGCLICPWCPAYRRRRVIKHKSESSISPQYPVDS